MGVRGSRRAFDGPLLRLAFRKGPGAAQVEPIGIVIATPDPSLRRSDPGNAGRRTTSWIAASACRPPRDDDSIRIRLASAVADRALSDARMAAGRGDPQSAKIVRPALGVSVAFVGVGKSGVGHAHKRAAVPIEEIDLDQA